MPSQGRMLGSMAMNRARLLSVVAVATLLAAGCTALLPGQREEPRAVPRARPVAVTPLPPFDPNGDRLVQVVQRVRPAVVNVRADVGGGEEAEGTGFVIRSNGVVVTNWHVVERGLAIRVITAQGERLDGRVIGGDESADLAVVQVETEGRLPTVPLGRSERLQLGETVVAVGFALGLEGGPSVTSGIVSGLGRRIQAGGPDVQTRTYEDVIQTDAAINPGNSGGPLVDLAGRVVGINTAGVGAGLAENIGFAIAIDRARPIIQHAVEEPEDPAPFLGVSTETVTTEVVLREGLTIDRGVLVAGLAPGGPAEEAGVQIGDVIVAVGGDQVTDNQSLQALLLEHEPEQEVTVTVARGSAREDIRVALGVRPLPVDQR
jgi:serine protease Do